MQRHLLAAGLLVAFSAALSPSESWAQACDPPGAAAAAGESTVGQLTTVIDTGSAAIVSAITTGVGQLSGNIQQLIVSNGKIADANAQNMAVMIRQNNEAQVMRDYSPSGGSCQTMSVTQGVSAAQVNRDQIHTALNSTSFQRTASAPGTPAAAGRDADAIDRIKTMKQLCPLQNGTWFMQSSTTPCPDVDPGSTLLLQDTLTSSQAQQNADQLIMTLVNPASLPKAPPNIDSTPEGRQWLLMLKNLLANLQLSSHMMNSLKADRMPVADATWMAQIYQAAGLPTDQPIPQNVSYGQLLKLDVQRRYRNPDWYTALHEMEPADLTRQLLHGQALQNEILMRILSRLEDNLTVNSVSLANQARANVTNPPAVPPPPKQ